MREKWCRKERGNKKDTASGLMTHASRFNSPWEVNVYVSCGMSHSVNVPSLEFESAAQIHPHLFGLEGHWYTHDPTPPALRVCASMWEHLCNEVLFLLTDLLWRHTTRAHENAVSQWQACNTPLQLCLSHTLTHKPVSMMLFVSLISILAPSSETETDDNYRTDALPH